MSTAQIPQHIKALALANETRFYRARVRADLKKLNLEQGAFYCALILEDDIPEMRTMLVEQLFSSIRFLGPSKVNRIFVKAHVGTNRTIGGLTQRQRDALAAALRSLGK